MILVITITMLACGIYIFVGRPLPILVWVAFPLALSFYNPNHVQPFIDISDYHFSYNVNWGSTFVNRDVNVFKPDNVTHLQAYLSDTVHPVRVTGSMHSYSPLVHTESMIDVRALDKILWYNGTHIRAQAGATIDKVQSYLAEYQKTLRGIGSITAQTLAGGFSTSLSGIEMCSFSQFATYAVTLDASGQRVEWHDLFFLRDSMGLMGVIVELEFQVFDNHAFTHTSHRRSLKYLFDGSHDAFDSILTFHSDRERILTVSYSANKTPVPIRPVEGISIFMRELVDYVVTPMTFWIPMHVFFGVLESSVRPDFEQLATIGHDAPLHGYVFIDYRIPLQNCTDFISMMQKQDGFIRIKLLNFRSDTCLAYSEKTCKVELYIPQHTRIKTYEPLAREFGGYSHWGKYYRGNITTQFETFECFDQFEQIRQQQDPTDRFKNAYLRGEPFEYWHGRHRLWLFHILIPLFFILQIWTCLRPKELIHDDQDAKRRVVYEQRRAERDPRDVKVQRTYTEHDFRHMFVAQPVQIVSVAAQQRGHQRNTPRGVLARK